MAYFVPLECQLIVDHFGPSEIEFWYSTLSLYLFTLSYVVSFRFKCIFLCVSAKVVEFPFYSKVEMNYSQIGYKIDFFSSIFFFRCQNSFTIFQPAFYCCCCCCWFVWAKHIFGNCSFLFFQGLSASVLLWIDTSFI